MDLFRVVIADDEETIRQGLREAIPWESIGYSVVGDAGNGREALKIIKENKPDLLIADVKMPVMDGLELVEIVNKQYPNIRSIILSGFDDFSYAQKAISRGVMEYILKPIYRPDFIDILNNIREKLQKDRERQKQESLMSIVSEEGKHVVRDKIIMDFINNQDTDIEKLNKRLSYFGLSVDFCYPTVVLIDTCINNINTSNSCDKMKYYAELRRNIENHMQENSVIFQNDEGIIGIILSWNDVKTIENLIKAVNGKKQFVITAGVGNPYKSLTDICKSYKQAVLALENKFYKGRGNIIFYNTIKPYQNYNVYPYDKEIRIFDSIKSENLNIGELVDEFYNSILEKGLVNVRDIYNTTMKLLIGIEKRTIFEIRGKTISNSSIISIEEITSLETLHELKDYINEYITGIHKYITQKNKNVSNNIIRLVIDYLQKEYKTANLSSAAEKVFVTPSYLSLLFKIETERTFVEWLTEIRIEKAKALLVNTNLKNYEIAEKVGYQDSRYFSQMFKKKVGVLPSEYRGNISARNY